MEGPQAFANNLRVAILKRSSNLSLAQDKDIKYVSLHTLLYTWFYHLRGDVIHVPALPTVCIVSVSCIDLCYVGLTIAGKFTAFV